VGLEEYIIIAIFLLSLFGCILCCKALVFYLFSIALDFAVPYLSSNVLGGRSIFMLDTVKYLALSF
jgi:hypothetical protein